MDEIQRVLINAGRRDLAQVYYKKAFIKKYAFTITEIVKRPADKSKPRLYFFHSGENVLENLQNRHSRPSQIYKELFPQIEKELKLSNSMKASWSQKAGCGCGCSPGFIIMNAFEIGLYDDIYVDIKG